MRFDTDHRVPGVAAAALEAMAGAIAASVSLLGLLGVYPVAMMGIGAVSVSSALLFEGASLSEHERAQQGAHGRPLDVPITGEILGGGGGLVLGVLAMVGVAPATLLPVAAMLLGAGLLFGGGSAVRALPPGARRELVASAGRTEILVGGAAVVLGILALLDLGNRGELVLAALLGLGAAVMLGGTAIAGRLVSMKRSSLDLPHRHGPILLP